MAMSFDSHGLRNFLEHLLMAFIKDFRFHPHLIACPCSLVKARKASLLVLHTFLECSLKGRHQGKIKCHVEPNAAGLNISLQITMGDATADHSSHYSLKFAAHMIVSLLLNSAPFV